MLQLKTWCFNIRKPNGVTNKQIDSEINLFLKTHRCQQDTFQLFSLDNDYIFANVMYFTKNIKDNRLKIGHIV